MYGCVLIYSSRSKNQKQQNFSQISKTIIRIP
jgi:hypothetical protein